MQCDIVPCLLWKTSLCILFIQIIISFFNYIYLLIILIFHKFKVISLSFESPFMHIKHLKCNRQIMPLDLNVLFVYQMCTIHSQNLRGYSCWCFKVQKELRLIKKTYLLRISTHLVQTCFWPSKLQILMMYFNKSCSFLYGEGHG
jgi:hypothetical protein